MLENKNIETYEWQEIKGWHFSNESSTSHNYFLPNLIENSKAQISQDFFN